MRRIMKQIFSVIEIASADINKKLIYLFGYVFGAVLAFISLYFCVKKINTLESYKVMFFYFLVFIAVIFALTTLIGNATLFITSFFAYGQGVIKGIIISVFSLAAFGLVLGGCIWGYNILF